MFWLAEDEEVLQTTDELFSSVWLFECDVSTGTVAEC